MGKASSMFKKLKTISKTGLKPYEEGKKNYELNIPMIEQIALERAETCLKCDYFITEPIEMFKISETRIPQISEKMCDVCGCSISYLLRQNIKICKKWQK